MGNLNLVAEAESTAMPKQTTYQNDRGKPVLVTSDPAVLAEYRQTMAEMERVISGAVKEMVREVKSEQVH